VLFAILARTVLYAQNGPASAARDAAWARVLSKKDDEITPLRNRRDDLTTRIIAACTRACAAIKGYFGENSSEY
jgi:hypothetical protein